ncbi:MAG: nitroreductase family protein [bacterium]|nr:nitroreductase family protein [bacterium]
MEREQYEALDILTTNRKSSRIFSGEPVPEDSIEKIKTIAYRSPYASGKKNWEIKVVDNKTIIGDIAAAVKKKTGELALRMRDDFRDGFEQYGKNFSAFESAPLLMVPVFRIQPSMSLMLPEREPAIEEYERDNFVKSISCAAMLILLAAESLGLGSCYMTGPLVAEEEIGRILKIKKKQRVGAVIPIGFVNN